MSDLINWIYFIYFIFGRRRHCGLLKWEAEKTGLWPDESRGESSAKLYLFCL